MQITIRPARLSDAPHLPAIERSAGQLFQQVAELAWIADAAVMSAEQHRALIIPGQVWVAEASSGALCGFICVLPQPGGWHIGELSVAIEWQQRGIGRQLLAQVMLEARQRQLFELTLTTFRQIPWNAPYYRRLGFQLIEEAELTAALRQIMLDELAHGLLPEMRCAMRLEL